MIDLDYKVIKFMYRTKRPMKIGKMRKHLNIPHSTLGSCIVRLKDQGYVNYEAYREVELTDIGKDLAIELIRHAKLLEILLYEELGLNAKEAHEESEKFNLLFSCNIINKICEKYGHPKKSPRGEVILNSSGCYCERNH